MSAYDKIYLTIAEDILKNGYCDANRTKTKAYKLPHQIMRFDLREEFPILTTKHVAFKTAVKEILWIYQKQSNKISDLHKENVHIWDLWAKSDATIGTSYGWVINEYKQMDYLLDNLKNNPQNRRLVMDMWQIPHLKGGALYPCCFLTMWDVTNGFLNCVLVQRSGDFPLGVPFNTTQYAVLLCLTAQVTGLTPGLLTHVINNAHIYENQTEGVKLQISRKNADYPAPRLLINPEIKNFYDFSAGDINLVDYRHHPKIEMEVSV